VAVPVSYTGVEKTSGFLKLEFCFFVFYGFYGFFWFLGLSLESQK